MSSPTTSRYEQLQATWWSAVSDAVDLLRQLDDSEWALPTDLPGWDVRAVAAHLAHLESELAGNPQPEVEVPEASHVKGFMGQFTERGPVARAEWPTSRIIDELEQSATARRDALDADPPGDLSGPASGFAGAIGWSWETLLSNRPLDLWMHEQDIRRATGRPGNLDTPGARHTGAVFSASLPFVLGKKVGAAPGTTAVLTVTGGPYADRPLTMAAAVGEDGRGAPLAEPPGSPDVRIELGFEDWIVLAGGRRGRAAVTARLEGDTALGEQLLDALAVTP